MNNILNGILYGLPVMLIGLFVVFAMLIILIVCISVMAMIFKGINDKKARKAEAEKKAAEQAAAAAAAAAPAPVQEAAPAAEEVDDPQLIAVIAAAIAAFDNSGKSLVVRKVRRVAGWNKSARQEQVYRF